MTSAKSFLPLFFILNLLTHKGLAKPRQVDFPSKDIEYDGDIPKYVPRVVSEEPEVTYVEQSPVRYVEEPKFRFIEPPAVKFIQPHPVEFVEPVGYVEQTPVRYVEQSPVKYVQQPCMNSVPDYFIEYVDEPEVPVIRKTCKNPPRNRYVKNTIIQPIDVQDIPFKSQTITPFQPPMSFLEGTDGC